MLRPSRSPDRDAGIDNEPAHVSPPTTKLRSRLTTIQRAELHALTLSEFEGIIDGAMSWRLLRSDDATDLNRDFLG